MRIHHYHEWNASVCVCVCASCEIVVNDLKFVCLLCVCLSLSMSTSTLNDIHHHLRRRSCCRIFISCFFFPFADDSNNFQHHFETFTCVIVKDNRNEKTALTRKVEIIKKRIVILMSRNRKKITMNFHQKL